MASLVSPTAFRDLVSGRRRGPMAAAIRGGLQLLEAPYTWAVRWRNHRYESRAARVTRVGVPVISVGNLTLGGTGKSPMVQWLARWLLDHQVPVAVVSRGYGARAGAANDEARELAWNLPEVPHVQNADRVAAALAAIAIHGCRAIVLDDGFQHRRLARDLDIVLLDALEPFGFDHVFPRGTLREPVAGLARAHIVALSRADLVGPEERAAIRRRASALSPQAAWIELAHAPRAVVGHDRGEEPLSWLSGRRVLAFCGIGNPAGFGHTLGACGWDVAALREFPDHHSYGPADIELLATLARQHGAAAVVCTQKDLVKLEVDRIGGLPLRAVRIGMEVIAGRAELESRLQAVLA